MSSPSSSAAPEPYQRKIAPREDSNHSPSRKSTSSPSKSISKKQQQRTLLQKFANFYLTNLEKHPILTKATTQATLSFLSNLIAQKLIKRQAVDWQTIFAFVASSFCAAPVIHFWYQFLAKHVKSLPVALFLDQVPFSMMYTIYYFSLLRIFKGFQIAQIPSDVKQNLFSTMKNSSKVWVPAQLINLKFVPPHLRVLFGNIVGFFWGIIFASISG